MKIFISSVRRGLEDERDALPGLILALGDEPLRFEDFTALPVPSREACLRGVQASDVYVLLLGAVYGDPLPETGLSPTAEEFAAAKAKGIPCVVFRKQGIEMEAAQEAFAAEVEAYATGRFRDTFTSAIDLQSKLVAALRDLPGSGLRWRRLDTPPTISWSSTWDTPLTASHSARLELHLLPVPTENLSRREVGALPDRLAERARAVRLVPPSAGVQVGSDLDAAWLLPAIESRRSSWREPDHGGVLGLRIQANGQRSTWEALPSDTMGTILDAADLKTRVAERIRLLGHVLPLQQPECAFALGLTTAGTTVEGSISDLGKRSSATGFLTRPVDFLIPPDEAVPTNSIDQAASEIASPIIDEVLRQFRAAR